MDLEYVGFGIVGLFVLTWAVAAAVWRFGRVEQRWTDDVRAESTLPAQR